MAQEQSPTAPFAVSSALRHYLCPVPSLARTFPKPIDRFLASTCVFDPANRLLLIQRSATDGWPLMWEVPGGCVDPTDETVVHAAARELEEEAGMTATSFKACVDEFGGAMPHVWEDDNPDKDWLWCRLAFVVEVKGGGEAVVLDEKEHQDFVWATEMEVREGRAGDRELKFVSDGMREILLGAFRVKNEVDRRARDGGDGAQPGEAS